MDLIAEETRPAAGTSRSRYLGISVHGHPRSGTHYLMALLNENFVQAPSYRDVDWGNREDPDRGSVLHALPQQCAEWLREGGKHIYVWREFAAVARSMLRVAAIFGIDRELSAEELARSRWIDVYTRGLPWQWLVDGEVESGVTSDSDPPLPDPTMTAYEFWAHHVDCWQQLAAVDTNVYVVKYEDLMNDFQPTMRALSKWLGEERSFFVNVTKKVGGQPTRPVGGRPLQSRLPRAGSADP